jgi:hypothetical protein
MFSRNLARRCLPAIGIAAVAVLAATGCHSGGSASSANTIPRAAGTQSGTATTTGGADEAKLVATAAACLRQHGANVPDPTIGPNGALQYDQTAVSAIPQLVLRNATQACSSELAAAQAAIPTNPNQVADRVKFAQCMRQHGVTTFPDPDPTTGQFPLQNRQVVASTPGFGSAQQACQSLLPNGNGAS